MGCWYKTCGLTNLPIMSGEDTYVFVLERVNEMHDHCYASHLYKPLLLPFISTYNDYGGGENSRGTAFQVVMDGIRKNLVEMQVGENEIHDIAVSRDAWEEELFFEAAHEGRLRIHWGGEQELDFVMIRKDVVDDLIASYEFEEYVGENKGTRGYRNSYVRYRLGDVVAGIDEFFDASVRIQKQMAWRWPRLDMLAFAMLEEGESKNRVAQWCRHDLGHRYCHVADARGAIVELLIQGDRVAAREIMEAHLTGMFVDRFMGMTRKSWIPGGHEGSQSQEYDGYRALIASMIRTMDERDARYAAEDGEDEEDDEDV